MYSLETKTGDFSRGATRRTLLRGAWSVLMAFCFWLAPNRVFAISLEQFDQTLDLRCGEGDSCLRSLRSSLSLGGYTGILVRGESGLSAEVKVRDRNFRAHISGSSLGSILFTWDGDRHPEILSGSGLRCLDVTQSDASAIIFKDFSLHGVCGGEECPPFVIETRLYDASDPTGQLYSASILRRANDRPSGDLVVPLSNFIRHGPRGAGRLTCVGAISAQIKFENFSDVILEMGTILTDSLVPLEVVGQKTLPEEDAVVATPSPTETEEVPSPVAAPPLVVEVVPGPPSQEEVVAHPTVGTKEGGDKPAVLGGTLSVEVVGTVVPTPRPRVHRKIEDPDDIVFGEVVKR
jgi:hypothetical protein